MEIHNFDCVSVFAFFLGGMGTLSVKQKIMRDFHQFVILNISGKNVRLGMNFIHELINLNRVSIIQEKPPDIYVYLQSI